MNLFYRLGFMKNALCLCILLLLIAVSELLCSAQPPAESKAKIDLQHSQFNQLIQKHVLPYGVKYLGLLDDIDLLKAYLKELEEITPKQLAKLKKNDRLAFWINAYNAHVLHIVTEYFAKELKAGNYKSHSILQIPGPTPRENVFKLKNLKVAGQLLSLDQIEKEVIPKLSTDCRIHFVLNCSAKSCPELLPHALTGSTLEQDLAESPRRFIRRHSRLSRHSRALHLNKVFSWQEKKFISEYGSVEAFIIAHAKEEVADYMKSTKVEIKYYTYNWELNIVTPDSM